MKTTREATHGQHSKASWIDVGCEHGHGDETDPRASPERGRGLQVPEEARGFDCRLPHGKGGKDTPTSKLSFVLEKTENQWMRSGVQKLHPDEGVVEVVNFLVDYLWQRRALKDVGAGAQHGEHSHRIQWYIIYHYFRGKGAPTHSIQSLYDTMVNPKYTTKNMVNVQVSLWDSVLDVRYSWLNGRHENNPVEGLKDVYGDVKYASPVFLNDRLTHPDSDLIKQLPRLSTALTRRRLKRTALKAEKTRELLRQCLEKAQIHIDINNLANELVDELIADVISSRSAHTQ
ncbi:LirA/MavJ family T4SS effector [Cystobacter fuscus]